MFFPKKAILFIILLILIVWLLIVFYFAFNLLLFNKEKIITLDFNQSSTFKNKKARLIDGLLVSEDYEELYPIAVVIDNGADSWPLSGLEKANLVYETTAEAGITRFLAFYATDEIVDKIGPVRSARPYFVDWAKEYQAILAHVGGSQEALSQIKGDEVLDLNQYFQSQYFWRNSSRPAPHNVYTSSALLKKAREDLAKEKPFYKIWQYKKDLSLNERPDKQEIEINFSSPAYKVIWRYDKEKNDYLRFQFEKPCLTENNSQVKAKNIIIQYTSVKVIDEIGRRDIVTTGKNTALFFLDGQVKSGFWERNKEERTIFLDENSQEIKLNRGLTWIEVVSNNTLIGYR